MIRRILAWLGYRIVYVSEFGVHDSRYDSVDAMMGRPIHRDMSVAPPWAKRRVWPADAFPCPTCDLCERPTMHDGHVCYACQHTAEKGGAARPARRPRVYIAGPISRGDLAHNVNQATAAFVALAKAGLAPLCPHWSVYSKPAAAETLVRLTCDSRGNHSRSTEQTGRVFCEATVAGNPDMTHDDWLAVDLAWVETADAVLRLPGESVGADREVAHAKSLGIPVLSTVEQVATWADHRIAS